MNHGESSQDYARRVIRGQCCLLVGGRPGLDEIFHTPPLLLLPVPRVSVRRFSASHFPAPPQVLAARFLLGLFAGPAFGGDFQPAPPRRPTPRRPSPSESRPDAGRLVADGVPPNRAGARFFGAACSRPALRAASFAFPDPPCGPSPFLGWNLRPGWFPPRPQRSTCAMREPGSFHSPALLLPARSFADGPIRVRFPRESSNPPPPALSRPSRGSRCPSACSPAVSLPSGAGVSWWQPLLHKHARETRAGLGRGSRCSPPRFAGQLVCSERRSGADRCQSSGVRPGTDRPAWRCSRAGIAAHLPNRARRCSWVAGRV